MPRAVSSQVSPFASTRPCVRPQQPRRHAQEARLARSGGPREREALARLDRQLDVEPQVAERVRVPQRASIRLPAAQRAPPWTSLTDSRMAADTATSTADSARAESKSVEKRS